MEDQSIQKLAIIIDRVILLRQLREIQAEVGFKASFMADCYRESALQLFPALSTKQHDKHVKAYFQHLMENGKTPLQGVCAVMRKLLHPIHGMLKKNEPFDNTRFYAIPESTG